MLLHRRDSNFYTWRNDRITTRRLNIIFLPTQPQHHRSTNISEECAGCLSITSVVPSVSSVFDESNILYILLLIRSRVYFFVDRMKRSDVTFVNR